MREILFRAKDFLNQWCYGTPVFYPNGKVSIFEPNENDDIAEYVIHRPETIGQYTGLKDLKGNKIFEGDIVRLWSDDDEHITTAGNGLIEFLGGCFEAYYKRDYTDNEDLCNLEGYRYQHEVIGNIHDNPELMEE